MTMGTTTLTFEDALQIARGCKDYGGGYMDGEHYEAFQHGIQTVINALEHAEASGLKDSQIAALYAIGGGEKPTEEKPSKPKVLNVNSTVRVKLTDHGRAVHAKDHADCWASVGVIRPYTPPTEDAHGWSKWTLWQLMQIFGPHINIGLNVSYDNCFEADIEVVE